jgi:hypothetical protein
MGAYGKENRMSDKDKQIPDWKGPQMRATMEKEAEATAQAGLNQNRLAPGLHSYLEYMKDPNLKGIPICESYMGSHPDQCPVGIDRGAAALICEKPLVDGVCPDHGRIYMSVGGSSQVVNEVRTAGESSPVTGFFSAIVPSVLMPDVESVLLLRELRDLMRELVEHQRREEELCPATKPRQSPCVDVRTYGQKMREESSDFTVHDEFSLEDYGDWFACYLDRQMVWSRGVFGGGMRIKGIIEHIRKECEEVLAEADYVLAGRVHCLEAKKKLLGEWVDLIILALDGAWRTGASIRDIKDALLRKQDINIQRKWPKPVSEDKAVEHVRGQDGQE